MDENKLTQFWTGFNPFFDISPGFFAIVQQAPILHFQDPSIFVLLGKQLPKKLSKVV